VVATQHIGAARFVAACWILAHWWLVGPAFAEPAKLTVQVDRPGPRISPTLYGIFFEEINLAGDGGLYAELVRNRSFEDTDTPDHWSLVTGGSMKGQMAIDTQQPMSAKNRQSLRLTIVPGGEGRLGVANADGRVGPRRPGRHRVCQWPCREPLRRDAGQGRPSRAV